MDYRKKRSRDHADRPRWWKRRTVLWPAGVAVSVVLAVVAVVLYAEHPGVATYQLNGLLLMPLAGLILYWLHGALPLRVQWIAALAIAPLGGIAYLLWPNEQWWNYGSLTVAPLMALAAERAGRKREESGEEPEPWYGGFNDGPWGPP